MPFIRVDVDIFDEIASEMDPSQLPPDFAAQRPSGQFEYSAAKVTFNDAKTNPFIQLLLEALRAMGATHFRVRYDGGYDEGFAHADSVTVAGSQRSIAEVAAELNKSPWRAAAQQLAAREGHRFRADESMAQEALDDLAHALASQLLGDGYGTGEYELYGAFTADLGSGDIVDDPRATPPDKN